MHPPLSSAEVEGRVELYPYFLLDLDGIFRANFTFIRYQPEESLRLVDRVRLMIHLVSSNRLYVLSVGSIDKRVQDNRSSELRESDVVLTFKNRASYIWDGSTATHQMLHFIYFFNKYKY